MTLFWSSYWVHTDLNIKEPQHATKWSKFPWNLYLAKKSNKQAQKAKKSLICLAMVGIREPLMMLELSTGVCAEWWWILVLPWVLTTWMWNLMGMFYTHKLGYKCGSHVWQYHLECIALKQAPTKWICKACEVSRPAWAKGTVTMFAPGWHKLLKIYQKRKEKERRKRDFCYTIYSIYTL